MIEHWLVDTIERVVFTRNKYGDYVYQSKETKNCRFREINSLTTPANREEFDCDAVVHFAAAEDVRLGDIYLYDGIAYKVSEIVRARRGGSTNVEFIKCALVRHRQIS